MARPRILDPVKRAELCNVLISGLDLHEAAKSVGCSPRTIRREMARDDAFRQQVSRILLANRLDPLHHIHQAALTDWRAAAWVLERVEPEQYARRDRASCSAKDLQLVVDRVIETVLREIDDEDRTRVYRTAAEVARQGFNELFPASRRDERRLKRGPMPLRDWEELNEIIEASAASYAPKGSPARGRRPGTTDPAAPPVETRTPADRTPGFTDKTTPVADKTTPVTDKTSPRERGPQNKPEPRNPGVEASPPPGEGREF